MKVLIFYWSFSGNTKKVALTIQKSLKELEIDPVLKKITAKGSENINFFEYDLIFIGTPVYDFLPPKPVLKFMQVKLKQYKKEGYVKLKAPRIGKNVVIFCTYAGDHTGESEAIPVAKYIGQIFDHLGFDIKGEWYIVGQLFIKSKTKEELERYNTQGKLGDIRGRPNGDDLAKVEKDVINLVNSLNQAI